MNMNKKIFLYGFILIISIFMFNIDVRLNTEVVKINREEKFVVSSNREKFYYDNLSHQLLQL